MTMKSEKSSCPHGIVNDMSAMRQISIARFWSYDTPISYVCKELLGIHF